MPPCCASVRTTIFTPLSRLLQTQLLKWDTRTAAYCLLAAMLIQGGVLSAAPRQVRTEMQSLPLSFEENRGQADPEYRYLLQRDGVEAMFLRGGVDFRLAGSKGSEPAIRLNLIGADKLPAGDDLLEGRSNYLIGADSSRWIRGVPHFRQILYNRLYPGISLAFYGNGDALSTTSWSIPARIRHG